MLGNNVVGGSAGLAVPGGGRVRSNNSMTLLHYNMLLHCKQILHVGCSLDATIDYLSYQQSHDNYISPTNEIHDTEGNILCACSIAQP